MGKRKILILGHARHGKDTVAKYLAHALELSFCSSSMLFAEHMMSVLPGYATVEKCWLDRVNHRAKWHTEIANYCKDDKARLAKLVYATNDIYCGVRAKDELAAIIKEFNPLILWVDASKRLPLEPYDSMQLSYHPTYNMVDNNKSEAWLYKQLNMYMEIMNG